MIPTPDRLLVNNTVYYQSTSDIANMMPATSYVHSSFFLEYDIFKQSDPYEVRYTLKTGYYILLNRNGYQLNILLKNPQDQTIAGNSNNIGQINFDYNISGIDFAFDQTNNKFYALFVYNRGGSNYVLIDVTTPTVNLDIVLEGSAVPEDPYGTSPEPISTGGYGSYDYGDGDDIPAPSKPSISASDSGFVTLFNPDLAQLQDLADYMWAGLFDFSNWRKLFADPMDCIIALNIVPVIPTVSGSRELKVGNIGTGKQFPVISEQFVEVNCGSITINGKTASNLDYSPYTSASIFLPFIGERQLDVDDIMDSTLTLTYIIDLFSGACTANIVCSKSTVKSWNKAYNKSRLLYSFSGNCACNIPITNASYNSVLSTLITAVGVGATAIATHGGSLAGGAGIAQAGALAQSVSNEKPVISKSGNMAGASGFMGARTPYLIMKFPNQCRPNKVNKEIGQPSYLRGTLSSFSGFTKVHETFLTDMPCTETEKNEIDRLLKEGVLV